MTPTLYGINFPIRHLNQAGALVCVYVDGSVVAYHAAVEMGQGVNTKVAQCVAQALGVPLDQVHVGDTAIDRVPNTSPTAASMGSDLNCMAVLDACTKINDRLKELKSKNPGLTFPKLCALAYKQRISLSAEGHYKTSRGAEYDWKMETDDNAKRGAAFSYFTFGIGVSEVELDVVTGQWNIRRSDLLMDCGDTLSAAVDIGQVEGAFIQGMGWLTMEELIFGDSQHPHLPPGVLFNAGAREYKIPGVADVPDDFRVELLSGKPNPMAVHGSKAVGEPPLFLAASVHFALKRAIYATHEGHDEKTKKRRFMPINSPLAVERIRMHCGDAIVATTNGNQAQQGEGKKDVAGSF